MVHDNGPPEQSGLRSRLRTRLDVRTIASLVAAIANVSRLVLELVRIAR